MQCRAPVCARCGGYVYPPAPLTAAHLGMSMLDLGFSDSETDSSVYSDSEYSSDGEFEYSATGAGGWFGSLKKLASGSKQISKTSSASSKKGSSQSSSAAKPSQKPKRLKSVPALGSEEERRNKFLGRIKVADEENDEKIAKEYTKRMMKCGARGCN